MGKQKERPQRVNWREVRRRIRVWLPSVSATVFWLSRTAKQWFH